MTDDDHDLDWWYDHRNEIAAEEAEGKTIQEVKDGYDQTKILFEDETFIEFRHR